MAPVGFAELLLIGLVLLILVAPIVVLGIVLTVILVRKKKSNTPQPPMNS